MKFFINKFLIVFCFFVVGNYLFAQNQTDLNRAKNWIFGHQAGLTFNPAPVNYTGNSISLDTREGCASISDINGNLLFYTDGIRVWRADGSSMLPSTNGNPPQAIPMNGSNISAQSAVVIPKPGSPDIYYLFTVGDWLQGPNGAFYSIVDMSNGTGAFLDLDPPNRTYYLMLDANARENLTGVHTDNGVDYWVILKEKGNSVFKSYKITSAGIDLNPVVSTVGESFSNTLNKYGCIKASPLGNKVCITLGGGATDEATVELFDFNNQTGELTNPQIIGRRTSDPLNNDNIPDAYSSEFSPNGEVLYVSDYLSGDIWAFDLTQSSTSAILNSRIKHTVSGNIGTLQLANDQNIYYAREQNNYIGMITNTNSFGAFTFNDNAVDLCILSGCIDRKSRLGLPNFISSFVNSESSCSAVIKLLYPNARKCSNQNIPFYISLIGYSASTNITWDFGDGTTATGAQASHVFTAAGQYTITCTVAAFGDCPEVTKTMNITIEDCIEEPPCQNCIPSFSPNAGKYVVSAWVREENEVNKTTFDQPSVYIVLDGGTTTLGPYKAKGEIIEGWQKIDEVFDIPQGTTSFGLKIENSTATTANDVLFDDIRVHPFDAMMKSYVFDPVTLRLMAELDERNYATFYEYDEDGVLVRVKKETEKGIVTVKENRSSVKKK